MREYKVVLWGAGEGYNQFVSLHGHEMVSVIALTDSNKYRYFKMIDGIPVISPIELMSVRFDYLIVCSSSEKTEKAIIKNAVELGINREIIAPLRIFAIPFFNFEDYVQIRKSNISILSDSCFAAYLYHVFGLQFTSPTINTYIDNENYLRFLKDIRGYLAMPMIEFKEMVDKPYKGMFAWPRGRVGDTEWIFTHAVDYSEVSDRWKKGAERFNYDNYLVTMSLESDDFAYEFDALPIQNKIGFYWKDLNLKSVVCMPEWKDPAVRAQFDYRFYILVNRTADITRGIRSINWMRALLHEDAYRRVE